MSDPDAEKLREQAHIARRDGRTAVARGLYQEALRRVEDRSLEASLYEELAYVERGLQDLKAAFDYYLHSSEIYRSLANPLKTAHTLRHAADIAREDKRPGQDERLDQAELYYSQAIEIYRCQKETSALDLGNAIRGYALLKQERGEPGKALNLWREARELYALASVEAGVSESVARINFLTD